MSDGIDPPTVAGGGRGPRPAVGFTARKGARMTRGEPAGRSSAEVGPLTGIAGLGIWVPPRVVTAEELAAETGIPAPVPWEKFGINQVRRAAAADVYILGVKAAYSG